MNISVTNLSNTQNNNLYPQWYIYKKSGTDYNYQLKNVVT